MGFHFSDSDNEHLMENVTAQSESRPKHKIDMTNKNPQHLIVFGMDCTALLLSDVITLLYFQSGDRISTFCQIV